MSCIFKVDVGSASGRERPEGVSRCKSIVTVRQADRSREVKIVNVAALSTPVLDSTYFASSSSFIRHLNNYGEVVQHNKAIGDEAKGEGIQQMTVFLLLHCRSKTNSSSSVESRRLLSKSKFK